MSDQKDDTPETVREKMANIPLFRAMNIHYFDEDHPGDYFDCWCAEDRERNRR